MNSVSGSTLSEVSLLSVAVTGRSVAGSQMRVRLMLTVVTTDRQLLLPTPSSRLLTPSSRLIVSHRCFAMPRTVSCLRALLNTL